jgi:hypothetical protein
MAYLGVSALKIAAQLFGSLGALDSGPYRLEGGGKRWDYIASVEELDKSARAPPEPQSIV